MAEPIIDLYVRLRAWNVTDPRAASALSHENQPGASFRAEVVKGRATAALMAGGRATNTPQAQWAQKNRDQINAKRRIRERERINAGDRRRRAERRAAKLEGIVIVELADIEEAM